MKNVEMTIEGNQILTIRIDLTKRLGPSKSKKTIVIATTEGNQPLPSKPRIKVGVNVYESQGGDKPDTPA